MVSSVFYPPRADFASSLLKASFLPHYLPLITTLFFKGSASKGSYLRDSLFYFQITRFYKMNDFKPDKPVLSRKICL